MDMSRFFRGRSCRSDVSENEEVGLCVCPGKTNLEAVERSNQRQDEVQGSWRVKAQTAFKSLKRPRCLSTSSEVVADICKDHSQGLQCPRFVISEGAGLACLVDGIVMDTGL